MKNKAKKSLFVRTPAWALSLMAFFATLGLFMLLDIIPMPGFISTEFGGAIIYAVFLTIACFLICRAHPNSVWYTPIICNALLIFLAVMDPDIWARIVMISIIAVSVGGAIVGARIGRSRINQAK